MTSAVPTLRVAIVTALEAIPQLASAGGSDPKVYREGSDAIRGTPLPYVVLGTASETRDGAAYHGHPGHDGTMQIKSWADNQWEADALDAEVVRVLDGQRFALAGHVSVLTSIERLTDFPEPEPDVGGHVVVSRLRTRTLVA